MHGLSTRTLSANNPSDQALELTNFRITQTNKVGIKAMSHLALLPCSRMEVCSQYPTLRELGICQQEIRLTLVQVSTRLLVTLWDYLVRAHCVLLISRCRKQGNNNLNWWTKSLWPVARVLIMSHTSQEASIKQATVRRLRQARLIYQRITHTLQQ